MKIPLPCKFGKTAFCDGKKLPLKGVSWYVWRSEIEFTYYFSTNDFWHDTKFYSTSEPDQVKVFEINDSMLEDKIIKNHGYPLKGRGYVCGVFYKNGKTYVDFIITSNYYEHIRVECDKNGKYIMCGDIIFPPSWDTIEKKNRAVLKTYKYNFEKNNL